MPTPRLYFASTVLLVVDMQEKLLPHMLDPAGTLSRGALLVDAFKALKLPIMVTEQYRKGLGATVPELAGKLPPGHEKLKFSACVEPVRQDLQRLGARAVVVAGIEAHVCVMQTCLDLLDAGLTVAVALDAVCSRRRSDMDAAVLRMTQAGVLPTTAEAAILELVHEAGTERFKAVLPLIR